MVRQWRQRQTRGELADLDDAIFREGRSFAPLGIQELPKLCTLFLKEREVPTCKILLLRVKPVKPWTYSSIVLVPLLYSNGHGMAAAERTKIFPLATFHHHSPPPAF